MNCSGVIQTNWIYVYCWLMLVSCSNIDQHKDSFKFSEDEIAIIPPDSTQIYSPSKSVQIYIDILDSTAFPENEIQKLFGQNKNDLLYILLSIIDEPQHRKIDDFTRDQLLNFQSYNSEIKKSLLGEFYLYKASIQQDPARILENELLAASYFEQSYGSLNTNYSKLVYNIGSHYLYQHGDYDNAYLYILKGSQLLEKNGTLDSILVQAYGDLAHLLMNRAEFLKALCYTNFANKLSMDTAFNMDSFVPTGLINEALYLEQLGERRLTQNCYDSLLSYDKNLIDYQVLILLYTNYANSLTYDRNFHKAEQLYQSALDLLTRESAYYSYTYSHYFNYLYETGRYDTLLSVAIPFLKLKDNDSYTLAYIHSTVALAYEKLNNIDSALKYMTFAWMVGADVEDEMYVYSTEELKELFDNYTANEYIKLLRIRMKYYSRKKDINAMISTLKVYDEIDAVFDRLLELGDEESQLHLMDYFTMIFSDALMGYYRLYEMGSINKQKILHFSERSKALLLRRNKPKKSVASIDQKYRMLKRIIDLEWQKLKMNYGEYNNYEFLLACLNERSIVEKKQESYAYEEIKMNDFTKVQEHVKKNNQLLISYCAHKDQLFGISLSDTNFFFKHWTLDSLDYQLINDLYFSISNEQLNDKASVQNFKDLSHEFYINFVEPLILNDSLSDWVIIKDGPILQIPFEVLLKDIRKENSYDELHYLIYDYDIRYHNNIAEIFKKEPLVYSNETSIKVFGYSNPETLSKPIGDYYVELPGTVKEIAQISKVLDLDKRNMYLGENCAKDHFLNEITSADVIHLATHAISDPSGQRINKVIFRPQYYDRDSMDHILTSAEISGLNIKASLVFLSACETGKGKTYSGEGVFNLGRSFLSAGAQHVIQSSWILDDFSASELVAGFYNNYSKGMNYHVALRKSKLSYIKEWPTKSQPFFWCGVN